MPSPLSETRTSTSPASVPLPPKLKQQPHNTSAEDLPTKPDRPVPEVIHPDKTVAVAKLGSTKPGPSASDGWAVSENIDEGLAGEAAAQSDTPQPSNRIRLSGVP